MRTPKLIATDIDGTLLFDWSSVLPAPTLELIERLLDAGIVFLPSSGRQYGNLLKLFAPVADRIPYVADNGALALIDNRVIYQATMERELGDQIVREITGHPECEPLVSGQKTSYVLKSDPELYEHMTTVMSFDITAVDDVSSAVTGEPYSKISAHYAGNDLDDERMAWWRKRFGSRCSVVTSGLTWLDFMPFGVSKAKGMHAVCDYLGIDPQDCLAFGDAGNDIEMLDFVGCPIVVESGTDEAKEHARYVVPSVEEALTRILDGEGFDW